MFVLFCFVCLFVCLSVESVRLYSSAFVCMYLCLRMCSYSRVFKGICKCICLAASVFVRRLILVI